MIDVSPYNKIVVGLSGGKDSTALMLWIKYESGWPIDKCKFVFFDTGNEDSLTYSYVKLLSDTVHPIEMIDPGIDFYTLARKRQRFPAAKSRFCTEELKIKPKHKMFAGMIDNGCIPLNVTGIRNEEGHSGNDRASVLELDYEQFTYNRKHYTLANANPLVEWTMDDVWSIHRKYIDLEDVIKIVNNDPGLQHKGEIIEGLLGSAIPSNPLYHMGSRRVGCFPCINSRKAEIRAMAKYRPERVDFIRNKEQDPEFKKGISTFFAIGTAPKQFRSKKIVAANGDVMYVSTIDDIVEWSQTAWGGKQIDMGFVDQPSICMIGQHCE